MEPRLMLSDMTERELIMLRQQINNVLSHRRTDFRAANARDEIRPAWVDRIVAAVALEHKQSVREILADNRTKGPLAARWEIWRRLRVHRGCSIFRIAVWFQRDHTTVRNALEQLGVLHVQKVAA